MIPPEVTDDAPPGERAALDALRDALGTDDWVVFHSLGIGRHITQFEGEADFVVPAPSRGILVIEVKSHLRVQTDNSGRWKLGSDGWTTRSPFHQASGAFHSIREFLRQRSLDFVGYPAGYVVWFTSIARQNIPPAIGWHDWAVMDAADLGSPASAIRRVLSDIDRDIATKMPAHQHAAGEPSVDRVERIRAALSPVFEAEIEGPRDPASGRGRARTPRRRLRPERRRDPHALPRLCRTARLGEQRGDDPRFRHPRCVLCALGNDS